MIGSFMLFGKEISSYAIAALAGILIAGIFAYRKTKKCGLDEIKMLFMLLFGAIGVFLGGHILYGITNIQYIGALFHTYSFWQFIQVFALIFGGQVFYGGLLGGIAAAAIYAKAAKLEHFGGYADIAAAAVPLFHTFGRIGCFLGGCCYGIGSEFGFTFHNSLIESANGVNRFPVQLCEALFNFVLFLVIYFLLKKGRMKNRLFFLYLLVYAIGRFFLEFLRGDSYRGFLFGLSTSQIISVLIAAVVFICLIVLRIKNKKESKKSAD